MTTSIGDAGVLFADGSLLPSSKYQFGFKNRIINGAMQINQRAFASITTASAYLVDRWILGSSNAFTTFGLTSDATVSLVNNNHIYLQTNAVLAAPAVGDFSFVSQRIEGNNIADLRFGKADAKTITISFRARPSVAGVYTLALRNGANNRSYVVPITMTTTVATYTVTIQGDTAGTWTTDNTTGLEASLTFSANTAGTFTTANANVWQAGNFIAHSTQSNGLDTLNRNLAVSDFQLELGSAATSFEFRNIDAEFTRCQRYAKTPTISIRFVATVASQVISTEIIASPPMRGTPTVSVLAGGASNISTLNPTGFAANGDFRLDLTSTAAGDCYAVDKSLLVTAEL